MGFSRQQINLQQINITFIHFQKTKHPNSESLPIITLETFKNKKMRTNVAMFIYAKKQLMTHSYSKPHPKIVDRIRTDIQPLILIK